MIVPFVLDGPINRKAFVAYVKPILMLELRLGDTVIMDNLSAHKVSEVREAIEATCARLQYAPLPNSGTKQPKSFQPFHPKKHKTTSSTQDAIQYDLKTP
jgi:hypothetical protein